MSMVINEKSELKTSMNMVDRHAAIECVDEKAK